MNNISEATKRLNISQSYTKIRRLHQLKMSWVWHYLTGKQTYLLNRYGELILNYIDSAFRELNEGERIIKKLTGIESGQVTFAITFPCYAITHSKLCVTTSQY